jgi:hypothetical protein
MFKVFLKSRLITCIRAISNLRFNEKQEKTISNFNYLVLFAYLLSGFSPSKQSYHWNTIANF